MIFILHYRNYCANFENKSKNIQYSICANRTKCAGDTGVRGFYAF
jgi:hypothetical protein